MWTVKGKELLWDRMTFDIIVCVFSAFLPFIPAPFPQVLIFLTSGEGVSLWKTEAAYQVLFFQAVFNQSSDTIMLISLNTMEEVEGRFL